LASGSIGRQAASARDMVSATPLRKSSQPPLT
jgi:hypothetical protein